MIKGKADDQEIDLIDRNDYCVIKLWDRHDIADALVGTNHEPSKENIDKVIQCVIEDGFDDVSDEDIKHMDELIEKVMKED